MLLPQDFEMGLGVVSPLVVVSGIGEAGGEEVRDVAW